jgi:hypothetical protein
MNGAFGVTYEQLQPKLSLSAGPSATKHGPNNQKSKNVIYGKKHMWGEVYEPIVDDKWPYNPHFLSK